MPISTIDVHKSQHLHNPVYIDANIIMVAISVWALITPYAYWRVDVSLPPPLVSRVRLESLARETTPPCLPSFLSLLLFLPILPLRSPSTR